MITAGLGTRQEITICSLPEDTDIVRGFEKVEGGSGLLSMMVPEVKSVRRTVNTCIVFYHLFS